MSIIIRKVNILNSYYYTIQEDEEEIMVSKLFQTKEECYQNIEVMKQKMPHLSQITIITTA
ncbi:MAG: hypothetical protein ACRCV7_04800 [Culicoidibacterales bacterium]